MIRETIDNGHPEGGIYEQFAYLPNFVVYPNSSDMNELGVIGGDGLEETKTYRMEVTNMMELFGIVGGIIVVSSYIPQIIKLWKTKSSKDISSLFVFFIMVGTLCLMLYSIFISDTIFTIINALASMMAGTVLVLSLLYSRCSKSNTNGKEGC